jgi:hypothetical protein
LGALGAGIVGCSIAVAVLFYLGDSGDGLVALAVPGFLLVVAILHRRVFRELNSAGIPGRFSSHDQETFEERLDSTSERLRRTKT